MKYVIVLLVNLFALNLRLRLFQNIFQRKQNKRLILLIVLLMGGISSGAMLAYPWVLQYINTETFSAASLTRQSMALLVSRVGVLGLLLSLRGKKIKFSQKMIIRIVTLLGFATFVTLGYLTLPVGVLLYFLCVAGAEEFLKLSVGQSFFAQFRIGKKDLLIFAILSAIGFALIENAVYLIRDPEIGLAISRNLTTVIMHVLFTGVIAYIITSRGEKNKARYLIAFIVGMLLHWLYNSFLSYNSPLLTAGMIIGGYFAVSYFLYKSDRLYLPK